MSKFSYTRFSQTNDKFLAYFLFLEVESEILVFVGIEIEFIETSLIVVDLPFISSPLGGKYLCFSGVS